MAQVVAHLAVIQEDPSSNLATTKIYFTESFNKEKKSRAKNKKKRTPVIAITIEMTWSLADGRRQKQTIRSVMKLRLLFSLNLTNTTFEKLNFWTTKGRPVVETSPI